MDLYKISAEGMRSRRPVARRDVASKPWRRHAPDDDYPQVVIQFRNAATGEIYEICGKPSEWSATFRDINQVQKVDETA